MFHGSDGATVDHDRSLPAGVGGGVGQVEALGLVEVELDGVDGLLVASSVAHLQPAGATRRVRHHGRQHLLLPREHDRDGTLIVMDLAQELAPWATATGTVIAAVGLLLAGRLKIQNRRQRLQLGSLYMNRFWAVDDELTMTDRLNEPERYARLRLRHVKLCEDEFDAARMVGSTRSNGPHGILRISALRYAPSWSPQ